MDQREIMVSVIMLAYNSERYIRQALQSVLDQETDFRFEILVGNDASQDRTGQIVEEMALSSDGRIRLFNREKNLGSSRNAFELLMQSRGKYLAFCESDDYWLCRTKLQRQVDFLERHADYIGCTHRCLLVDDGGTPKRRQHLPWVKYKKRFRFRDFSGGRYLPGQTATVVKRNLFRDSEEDWSILYAIDSHISDRIANEIYLLRGDFYCFDETWSAYRCKSEHGGSNLTSRLFRDNTNKCEYELRMTEALEKYAEQKLSHPVRFSLKRSDILLDSVVELMRHRDGQHRAFAREMLKDSTTGEIAYLPLAFARKAINTIR